MSAGFERKWHVFIALTFRAWDQTTGTDGGTADTTTSGGGTAFSSATDGISLTVTPVNDPPTATNLSAAENYTEDTARNLIDIVVSDVDSATVTATLTLSNPSCRQLEHGHIGNGHIDLCCRHRRVDGERGHRQC